MTPGRRKFVFLLFLMMASARKCPDLRFLPSTLNEAGLMHSLSSSVEFSDTFHANTSSGYDFVDVNVSEDSYLRASVTSSTHSVTVELTDPAKKIGLAGENAHGSVNSFATELAAGYSYRVLIHHGNSVLTVGTGEVSCPEMQVVLSVSAKSNFKVEELGSNNDKIPTIPPFSSTDWTNPFGEYRFESSSGEGRFYLRSPTKEEREKDVRLAWVSSIQLPRLVGRNSFFSIAVILTSNYLMSGSVGFAIMSDDDRHGSVEERVRSCRMENGCRMAFPKLNPGRRVVEMTLVGGSSYTLALFDYMGQRLLTNGISPFDIDIRVASLFEDENLFNCPAPRLPGSLNLVGLLHPPSLAAGYLHYREDVFLNFSVPEEVVSFELLQPSYFRVSIGASEVVDVDLALSSILPDSSLKKLASSTSETADAISLRLEPGSYSLTFKHSEYFKNVFKGMRMFCPTLPVSIDIVNTKSGTFVAAEGCDNASRRPPAQLELAGEPKEYSERYLSGEFGAISAIVSTVTISKPSHLFIGIGSWAVFGSPKLSLVSAFNSSTDSDFQSAHSSTGSLRFSRILPGTYKLKIKSIPTQSKRPKNFPECFRYTLVALATPIGTAPKSNSVAKCLALSSDTMLLSPSLTGVGGILGDRLSLAAIYLIASGDYKAKTKITISSKTSVLSVSLSPHYSLTLTHGGDGSKVEGHRSQHFSTLSAILEVGVEYTLSFEPSNHHSSCQTGYLSLAIVPLPEDANIIQGGKCSTVEANSTFADDLTRWVDAASEGDSQSETVLILNLDVNPSGPPSTASLPFTVPAGVHFSFGASAYFTFGPIDIRLKLREVREPSVALSIGTEVEDISARGNGRVHLGSRFLQSGRYVLDIFENIRPPAAVPETCVSVRLVLRRKIESAKRSVGTPAGTPCFGSLPPTLKSKFLSNGKSLHLKETLGARHTEGNHTTSLLVDDENGGLLRTRLYFPAMWMDVTCRVLEEDGRSEIGVCKKQQGGDGDQKELFASLKEKGRIQIVFEYRVLISDDSIDYSKDECQSFVVEIGFEPSALTQKANRCLPTGPDERVRAIDASTASPSVVQDSIVFGNSGKASKILTIEIKGPEHRDRIAVVYFEIGYRFSLADVQLAGVCRLRSEDGKSKDVVNVWNLHHFMDGDFLALEIQPHHQCTLTVTQPAEIFRRARDLQKFESICNSLHYRAITRVRSSPTSSSSSHSQSLHPPSVPSESASDCADSKELPDNLWTTKPFIQDQTGAIFARQARSVIFSSLSGAESTAAVSLSGAIQFSAPASLIVRVFTNPSFDSSEYIITPDVFAFRNQSSERNSIGATDWEPVRSLHFADGTTRSVLATLPSSRSAFAIALSVISQFNSLPPCPDFDFTIIAKTTEEVAQLTVCPPDANTALPTSLKVGFRDPTLYFRGEFWLDSEVRRNFESREWEHAIEIEMKYPNSTITVGVAYSSLVSQIDVRLVSDSGSDIASSTAYVSSTDRDFLTDVTSAFEAKISKAGKAKILIRDRVIRSDLDRICVPISVSVMALSPPPSLSSALQIVSVTPPGDSRIDPNDQFYIEIEFNHPVYSSSPRPERNRWTGVPVVFLATPNAALMVDPISVIGGEDSFLRVTFPFGHIQPGKDWILHVDGSKLYSESGDIIGSSLHLGQYTYRSMSCNCHDRGRCRIVDETCECSPPWAGPECTLCESGFHLDGPEENGICMPDEICLPETCNSHGDCSSDNGLAVCVCDVGYSTPTVASGGQPREWCSTCAEGYFGFPSCTPTSELAPKDTQGQSDPSVEEVIRETDDIFANFCPVKPRMLPTSLSPIAGEQLSVHLSGEYYADMAAGTHTLDITVATPSVVRVVAQGENVVVHTSLLISSGTSIAPSGSGFTTATIAAASHRAPVQSTLKFSFEPDVRKDQSQFRGDGDILIGGKIGTCTILRLDLEIRPVSEAAAARLAAVAAGGDLCTHGDATVVPPEIPRTVTIDESTSSLLLSDQMLYLVVPQATTDGTEDPTLIFTTTIEISEKSTLPVILVASLEFRHLLGYAYFAVAKGGDSSKACLGGGCLEARVLRQGSELRAELESGRHTLSLFVRPASQKVNTCLPVSVSIKIGDVSSASGSASGSLCPPGRSLPPSVGLHSDPFLFADRFFASPSANQISFSAPEKSLLVATAEAYGAAGTILTLTSDKGSQIAKVDALSPDNDGIATCLDKGTYSLSFSSQRESNQPCSDVALAVALRPALAPHQAAQLQEAIRCEKDHSDRAPPLHFEQSKTRPESKVLKVPQSLDSSERAEWYSVKRSDVEEDGTMLVLRLDVQRRASLFADVGFRFAETPLRLDLEKGWPKEDGSYVFMEGRPERNHRILDGVIDPGLYSIRIKLLQQYSHLRCPSDSLKPTVEDNRKSCIAYTLKLRIFDVDDADLCLSYGIRPLPSSLTQELQLDPVLRLSGEFLPSRRTENEEVQIRVEVLTMSSLRVAAMMYESGFFDLEFKLFQVDNLATGKRRELSVSKPNANENLPSIISWDELLPDHKYFLSLRFPATQRNSEDGGGGRMPKCKNIWMDLAVGPSSLSESTPSTCGPSTCTAPKIDGKKPFSETMKCPLKRVVLSIPFSLTERSWLRSEVAFSFVRLKTILTLEIKSKDENVFIVSEPGQDHSSILADALEPGHYILNVISSPLDLRAPPHQLVSQTVPPRIEIVSTIATVTTAVTDAEKKDGGEKAAIVKDDAKDRVVKEESSEENHGGGGGEEEEDKIEVSTGTGEGDEDDDDDEEEEDSESDETSTEDARRRRLLAIESIGTSSCVEFSLTLQWSSGQAGDTSADSEARVLPKSLNGPSGLGTWGETAELALQDVFLPEVGEKVAMTLAQPSLIRIHVTAPSSDVRIVLSKVSSGENQSPTPLAATKAVVGGSDTLLLHVLEAGSFEIEFKSTVNDRGIGEESAISGGGIIAERASVLLAVESKRHLAARLSHMNSLCNPQPLPDHNVGVNGALFWEKRDLQMLISDEVKTKQSKAVVASFNLVLSSDSDVTIRVGYDFLIGEVLLELIESRRASDGGPEREFSTEYDLHEASISRSFRAGKYKFVLFRMASFPATYSQCVSFSLSVLVAPVAPSTQTQIDDCASLPLLPETLTGKWLLPPADAKSALNFIESNTNGAIFSPLSDPGNGLVSGFFLVPTHKQPGIRMNLKHDSIAIIRAEASHAKVGSLRCAIRIVKAGHKNAELLLPWGHTPLLEANPQTVSCSEIMMIRAPHKGLDVVGEILIDPLEQTRADMALGQGTSCPSLGFSLLVRRKSKLLASLRCPVGAPRDIHEELKDIGHNSKKSTQKGDSKEEHVEFEMHTDASGVGALSKNFLHHPHLPFKLTVLSKSSASLVNVEISITYNPITTSASIVPLGEVSFGAHRSANEFAAGSEYSQTIISRLSVLPHHKIHGTVHLLPRDTLSSLGLPEHGCYPWRLQVRSFPVDLARVEPAILSFSPMNGIFFDSWGPPVAIILEASHPLLDPLQPHSNITLLDSGNTSPLPIHISSKFSLVSDATTVAPLSATLAKGISSGFQISLNFPKMGAGTYSLKLNHVSVAGSSTPLTLPQSLSKRAEVTVIQGDGCGRGKRSIAGLCECPRGYGWVDCSVSLSAATEKVSLGGEKKKKKNPEVGKPQTHHPKVPPVIHTPAPACKQSTCGCNHPAYDPFSCEPLGVCYLKSGEVACTCLSGYVGERCERCANSKLEYPRCADTLPVVREDDADVGGNIVTSESAESAASDASTNTTLLLLVVLAIALLVGGFQLTKRMRRYQNYRKMNFSVTDDDDLEDEEIGNEMSVWNMRPKT